MPKSEPSTFGLAHKLAWPSTQGWLRRKCWLHRRGYLNDPLKHVARGRIALWNDASEDARYADAHRVWRQRPPGVEGRQST